MNAPPPPGYPAPGHPAPGGPGPGPGATSGWPVPGFVTPPAATVLRVLTAVQAIAALAGAVQAGVFTADLASKTTDDTVEGWFQGLGAFLGAVFVFAAVLTAVVLGALTAGLRDRPHRRHTGVLAGIVVAEVVLLVPAGALSYSALSPPVALDVAAVPTVVTAAALAVVVLAFLPATRAWARGPVSLPTGPWPPGPGQPVPWQPGPWQSGPPQPGPWQSGPGQPGPWQPGPGQPGPWQPGPWQPGP